MEQGLAVPGCECFRGGLLNAQAVGKATVMMHVVDEWNTGRLADWQEIVGREDLIVVLNG